MTPISRDLRDRDGTSGAIAGGAERMEANADRKLVEVSEVSDHARIVRDLIDRIGPSDLAVILVGDDRIACRRVASALHRRSPRRAGPFVALDCAIAAAALEPALFGRADPRAGAPGILERACGGTAYLDRVDDLPAEIQLELMCALEDRQIVPVGAGAPQAIDVRVIASSSRDLADAVEHGRWRADLFYRLEGISIAVPRRRQRKPR